jgi:hypothetical protein
MTLSFKGTFSAAVYFNEKHGQSNNFFDTFCVRKGFSSNLCRNTGKSGSMRVHVPLLEESQYAGSVIAPD